jgi:predicted PurR-regulated permease PerM
MTQRRSKIPMLGLIFFSIIIIGSATNGKPGMLISIIATALILFFIHALRKKLLNKQENTSHTDKELVFLNAQQQSHIQLMSIFIPLLLICGAISGDITVFITIIVLILIYFAYFLLKKRSPEQQAIYCQEKKILFGYTVFGLVIAALTLYFDLAK